MEKKKKSSSVLERKKFDPNNELLYRSWFTNAPVICCVNSYPNGVTLSIHDNRNRDAAKAGQGNETVDSPAAGSSKTADDSSVDKFFSYHFHLRIKDTRDYQLPDGKYFLYKKDFRESLEARFSQLHKKGLLKSAVVYFGTTSDPFALFHKRFDVTTACLDIFERYQPGTLVVQTRSPMVIAGLPTLKYLSSKSVVVMPIESHLERAIAHYTPGQPKISERLVAAQGLRRQGVRVNLSASPVLPYGDYNRDAWDFAELLDRYADYISVGCLASGTASDEKQLKTLPLGRKLESDKQFHWLRPHAYQALYEALEVVAPEKLKLPVQMPAKPSQIALFAA